MILIDVAMIMFSCVMAIHMGLVDSAIRAYNAKSYDVPVITCPKCLTFWCVLIYMCICGCGFVHSIATSFVASYAAIWFDLFLGRLDNLYEKIATKIRKGW